MAPEAMKHLFEPFFTTKEVGKGTGLGLAAVYGCVRQHRGHITVDSSPGRGTTVRMLLPLSGESPIVRPVADKLPAEPRTGPMSGRILLVDDEDLVRDTTADLLRRAGLDVTACVNGTEAVEKVRQLPGQFDLAIVDLIMPGLSGAQVVAQLRAIDPNLKAIVASGYSVDHTLQEAKAAGSLAHVAKPFEISDLLSLIRRLLEGRA